jgi:hypothetical protein
MHDKVQRRDEVEVEVEWRWRRGTVAGRQVDGADWGGLGASLMGELRGCGGAWGLWIGLLCVERHCVVCVCCMLHVAAMRVHVMSLAATDEETRARIAG